MQKLPVPRCRADATACCRSASGQAVDVDSAASRTAATQLRGPASLQRAAPFQTSRGVRWHAGEATSRHKFGAGRQCGAGRLEWRREDPNGPGCDKGAERIRLAVRTTAVGPSPSAHAKLGSKGRSSNQEDRPAQQVGRRDGCGRGHSEEEKACKQGGGASQGRHQAKGWSRRVHRSAEEAECGCRQANACRHRGRTGQA